MYDLQERRSSWAHHTFLSHSETMNHHYNELSQMIQNTHNEMMQKLFNANNRVIDLHQAVQSNNVAIEHLTARISTLETPAVDINGVHARLTRLERIVEENAVTMNRLADKVKQLTDVPDVVATPIVATGVINRRTQPLPGEPWR